MVGEEKREAFRQEALDAWDDYQATGRHLTAAEADGWLAELEAGNDVEPPRGLAGAPIAVGEVAGLSFRSS